MYVIRGYRNLFKGLAEKIYVFLFLGCSSVTVLLILYLIIFGREGLGPEGSFQKTFLQSLVFGFIFTNFLPKLTGAIFLLIDDVKRLVQFLSIKFFTSQTVSSNSIEHTITRSDFLLKAGTLAVGIHVGTLLYGMVKSAYDYRIHRVKLRLPGLPVEFQGLKIAQISDIHCGSFYNRRAVTRGVDMLMNENPDIVFFTGDMVNDRADEVKNYCNIFSKIKAPLGVFAILGNHDYGDYIQWKNQDEKKENLNTLIQMQKDMGWDVLLNENRVIKKGIAQVAIAGVENWGAKNWSQKHGNLSKALIGTSTISCRLLLSHDPSHWDAQILDYEIPISATFSGHTHGLQFGVDNQYVKWSPAKYFYPQWAGLYEKNGKFLYVNRGFGFIGFPGRVGILPEITVFSLYS